MQEGGAEPVERSSKSRYHSPISVFVLREVTHGRAKDLTQELLAEAVGVSVKFMRRNEEGVS
jgi:hypothetical protein